MPMSKTNACGREIPRKFPGVNHVSDAWSLTGGAQKAARGAIRMEGLPGTRATQRIVLNQEYPALITAGCESRAEGVAGNLAYEYSFMLKIVFTDGTTNWLDWVPFNDGSLHYSDYVPFSNGDHSWEKRELHLHYAKPVREIDFELIFNNHTGAAEFRSFFLWDFSKDGVSCFDALPVRVSGAKPAGFMLRDAAAGSQFTCFENGAAHGIRLEAGSTQRDGHECFEAALSYGGGADRAVTLYYTLPVDAARVTYLPDMLHAVDACRAGDYLDASCWNIGANGFLSRMPFAAVTADGKGLAIGFDAESPAFGRVGYNGAAKELYIAFDVALTDEVRQAKLKFTVFPFDAALGYRHALETYYGIYEEAYRTRIDEQGNWMAFAKISEVEGWEDFHFKFKEGDNEIRWDREHGMMTFRYTEPMTWWMHMKECPPKSAGDVLAYYEKVLNTPDDPQHSAAKAAESSAMHDAAGKPVFIIQDRPWCLGAVWSMNTMPGIPGDSHFKQKWNDAIERKYHTKGSPDEISGEYVDSTEGYVTVEITHRRDHFKHTRMPLTFSKNSCIPGIFKGMIVYEYMKRLADDMWALGKFTMGNGTPGTMWFLPCTLDVAGTETDWCVNGKWVPPSLDELCFRRSACAAKPYCFLMNTNFEVFTVEMSEKYIKRSLAFGIFPSFFSANAATGHYFTQPALYNRDRPLFKKYLPVIKRLAEAGWRPVTRAVADVAAVHLERFGDSFVTVLNDSDKPVTVRIVVDLPHGNQAREMLSGTDIAFDGKVLRLAIGPEDVKVLQL